MDREKFNKAKNLEHTDGRIGPSADCETCKSLFGPNLEKWEKALAYYTELDKPVTSATPSAESASASALMSELASVAQLHFQSLIKRPRFSATSPEPDRIACNLGAIICFRNDAAKGAICERRVFKRLCEIHNETGLDVACPNCLHLWTKELASAWRRARDYYAQLDAEVRLLSEPLATELRPYPTPKVTHEWRLFSDGSIELTEY